MGKEARIVEETMIESVRPPLGAQPTGAAREPQRVRREPAAEAVAGATFDGVPSTPPEEVLDALNAAARTLAELADRRIELRIAADDASLDIQVDVRSASGEVIRRIPVSRAVGLLSSGDTRGLLVDQTA
jgi:hypothetical protein